MKMSFLLVMGMLAALATPLIRAAQPDASEVFPSERQQNCNLLIGIVSAAPTWRDNFVPVDVAFANVDSALQQMHAPYRDWAAWHTAIVRVYGTKMTSDDVERDLRPRCH